MIHIKSIQDIKLVKNDVIKRGLENEFNRLPNDFKYPEYGYFIVIENLDELLEDISLRNNNSDILYQLLIESIEMIEKFDGYFQIVCILDNDFGVSLFVDDKIISVNEFNKLIGS